MHRGEVSVGVSGANIAERLLDEGHPVWLILNDQAALLGAAEQAAQVAGRSQKRGDATWKND